MASSKKNKKKRRSSSRDISQNAAADRPSPTHVNPASHERTKSSSSGPPELVVSSNWMRLQKQLHEGFATLKRKRELEGISSGAECGSISDGRHLTGNLSPLDTDCSVTRVLAMDCEMVGVGFQGKRNSLVRVSIVNLSGNIVYDKHVRPLEFVTDCRTKITGVRLRDLRQGESFISVQEEVAALLKGRILVGHALHNDLKVLLLSHPRKDIRDTSTFEPLRSEAGRPQSLKHLAEKHLGCKIQEKSHCSVEDARAAMFLYNMFKLDWEISKHCQKRIGSIQ